MWRRLLHTIAGRLRLKTVFAESDDPGVETPLFERYLLPVRPWGGAAYLHHYLRSDPDRGVHDHPWGWAIAIPLAGGYVEERLTGFDVRGPVTRMIRRRPFLPYVMTGRDFHRLHLVEGRTSWSLFIHGRRMKLWGFLRAWVPFGYGRRTTGYFPYRDEINAGDEWWGAALPGRLQERAAP
ncbi:hypothetical protein [Zavarzinia sp.]|uniref:hypothetical protein n=1 Tax=Zavarzinia sp. TaxID=2027920 RepID=UPI003BB6719D